jgi:hypothetical protein
MATRQSALPQASGRERVAAACARSLRGCKWLTWQCHFGSVHSRIMAGLLESIVRKLPIVAVVVLDSDAMLSGIFFQRQVWQQLFLWMNH